MPVSTTQLRKVRKALDQATASSEAEEAPVPIWVVRLLCELYELLVGLEASAKTRSKPRRKPTKRRR